MDEDMSPSFLVTSFETGGDGTVGDARTVLGLVWMFW